MSVFIGLLFWIGRYFLVSIGGEISLLLFLDWKDNVCLFPCFSYNHRRVCEPEVHGRDPYEVQKTGAVRPAWSWALGLGLGLLLLVLGSLASGLRSLVLGLWP